MRESIGAEAKAGLVALLGLPVCFAVAPLLLTMAPWLARGRASACSGRPVQVP